MSDYMAEQRRRQKAMEKELKRLGVSLPNLFVGEKKKRKKGRKK